MSAPQPVPNGPLPQPVVILGLGGVCGTLLYLFAAYEARKCTDIGQCLTDWVLTLAGSLILLPLLGLAAMMVFRFPKRDLLAIPLTLVGGVLWSQALDDLYRASVDYAFDTYSVFPWWGWVLAITLTGFGSWLLVRKARTPLWLRILAPLLAIGLIVPFRIFVAADEHDHDLTQLRKVPVTLFAPDLGPGVSRRKAYPILNQGTIVVPYVKGKDSTYSMPEVFLIPSRGRSTCEATDSVLVLGFNEDTCTGDEFVTTETNHVAIGVRRGETILVASVRFDSGLTPDTVTQALRAAPEVTAEQLLRP